MENLFVNLNQSEIAGLLAQLVTLPFIITSAKNWWLASQSKNWLKTSGKVIKGLDFSISGQLIFLYEYEISGKIYQGEKPYFANSYKNLRGKKPDILMEKYPGGKQIAVFYNPSNPKISTLEPGRKDGVMGTLVLMILLFSLGVITYYIPSLIVKIVDYVSNF